MVNVLGFSISRSGGSQVDVIGQRLAALESQPVRAMSPTRSSVMMLRGSGDLVQIKAASGSGTSSTSATSYKPNAPVEIRGDDIGLAQASMVSVWAYRCIQIRMQKVSRMPKRVVDRKSKQVLAEHPFMTALQDAWRYYQQDLISSWEMSLCIHGEAYFEKIRNIFGAPVGLRWLNPIAVEPFINRGRIVRYDFHDSYAGRYIPFQPDEIIYHHYQNPLDDYRGLSPTMVALNSINVERDIERSTKSWYQNDSRPDGIVTPRNPIDDIAYDALVEKIRDQLKGAQNRGRTFATNEPVDWQQVQREPIPTQEEQEASVRRKTCAGYGVPLSIAGAWDDAQYQSSPEQRKSLYEETIIPECETLEEIINAQVMPFFDEWGSARFEHDYSEIKALLEDAAEKATVISSRMQSGSMTINESRIAFGDEPIPGGDVLLIPQGYYVVQVAKLPDVAAVVDQQRAGGTAAPAAAQPMQPLQFPQRPLPPMIIQGAARSTTKTIDGTATDVTALDELNQWEAKAVNRGSLKALAFVCYTLPENVQLAVRERLAALGKSSDKRALRDLFAEVKATMLPGEDLEAEALAFWKEYDALQAKIGDDWIRAYMKPAYATLKDRLGPGLSDGEIMRALGEFTDDLVKEWVGTKEQPGPLMSLVMAGMAAGDAALRKGVTANPHKPVKTVITPTVDWNLLSSQAYDYSREYCYGLIQGINDTTRDMVRAAIGDWIQTGQPVADLQKTLEGVFDDPVRAQAIAQTESTRAYFQGSLERYKTAGVTKGTWNTVNVGLKRDRKMPGDVCSICAPLHLLVGDIQKGWTHPVSGKVYQPPAHTGCRCFVRPVVE